MTDLQSFALTQLELSVNEDVDDLTMKSTALIVQVSYINNLDFYVTCNLSSYFS